MADNNRTILLGVDPSLFNMGVAVYNPKSKLLKLASGDMLNEILPWLAVNVKMKNVIAIVENPNLDTRIFGAWEQMKEAVMDFVKYKLWQLVKAGKPPKKVSYDDLESTFSILMKRAQSVGKNKDNATLIIRMLRDKGVPVLEIAPSSRTKAYRTEWTKAPGGRQTKTRVNKNVLSCKFPTKTDKEQFAKLTGFTKQSSEHSRDAATLVYGITIPWVKTQIKIQEARKEKRPKSYPTTENGNYTIFGRKVKIKS